MTVFPRFLAVGWKRTAELDDSRLLIAFRPGTAAALIDQFIVEFPELERETGFDAETGRQHRLNEGPLHVWLRVTSAQVRELISSLRRRAEVDWIGPVYRIPAERGMMGLFCPPPNRLMLRPTDPLRQEAAALAEALSGAGLDELPERSQWLDEFRFCVVRDPSANVYGLGERLREQGICDEWSYDTIPVVSPYQMATPAETNWPQQHLVDIHMPTAWDLPAPFAAGAPNLGRSRVYVCIVDNGCQSAAGGNADLVRSGNYGWEVAAGAGAALGVPTAPGLANGEGAHGTACAGIAVGEWEANDGIVGVAPMCRVFSLALTAPASAADMTSALNAARTTTGLPNEDPVGTADRDKEHRRVILLSVVHTVAASVPLASAIANALAADIPVIIPTGNGDTSPLPFPASEAGVIRCGAVRASGVRVTAETTAHGTSSGGGATWGSNFSATEPFVVAPGMAVKTSDLNGAQGYVAGASVLDFQGTSAAAAHAAGLAALLLSHNPRLLADDVRKIIYSTAEKVFTGTYTYSAADGNHPDGTWNQNVGYGRIHAQLAVQAARVVRAEVQVITGSDTTACEFGDVLYRRTATVEIRLRHIASQCTRDIIFELPSTLPTHCQWESGTSLTQTVSSGSQTIVRLQYTAPSADEEITSPNIVIKSDDYRNRTVTLSFHARSVAPPIVDSVLVLDRSGSMAGTTVDGSTRSQAVAAAAHLFVDLLEDEDRLGIVRFDDRHRNPEDVLTWMTLAGPMGSRSALHDPIDTGNPLAPAGSTTIAGGMKLGMEVLEALTAASPAHARAMVVMTDGHHNTNPTYASAYSDINAATQGRPRVFAVGVGLDTIDSEFDAIVEITGGYKYQTGPIVSDTVVQELFTKVLSNTVDADFATDPPRIALPGDKQSTDVVIGDTDFQADFIVLFGKTTERKRKFKIWLEAPDGTIIQATDILAGTVANMTGASRPEHLVLRCIMPPFAGTQGHLGTWKVWLENGMPPSTNDEQNAQMAIRYSVMAMVKSDFKMRGHLVHANRSAGAPFEIVVEPTLFGVPVKLASDPTARVRRPDGVIRLVQLGRDAHGAYVGNATDTGLPGVYTVNVDGTAVSPAGINVNRQLQLQTMVAGSTSLTTTAETPEGGLGVGSGGRRPGCLAAIWCGFWCFWWRLFTCGGCRPRLTR